MARNITRQMTLRPFFVLIVTLVCTATFLILLIRPETVFFNAVNSYDAVRPLKNGEATVDTKERKYILMWTTFFGNPDYLPKPGPDVGCPAAAQNCRVTSDKSLYNKSQVVIFHWADMMSPSSLPTYRTPDQYWMLFLLESPHHTSLLKEYDMLMNWTGSYRLDSDFFTPYVSYAKLNETERQAARNMPKVNHLEGKTQMVAWFVSNCHTPSNREGYVKELSKHIDVHIYGACGNNTCYPKMSPKCYDDVALQFRFYLSFENSICRDYVTEKYYLALQSNMIPVVYGGANYSAVGPPGAFIDASQFPDPAKLGEFLKSLANDSERYNAYFDWRLDYKVPGGRDWICDVCEVINGRHFEPKPRKSDLNTWWFKEANCKSWRNRSFIPG